MNEYIFGKYIYLDYLVMINKLTDGQNYLECPIRYSDDEMLTYLNSILQHLMEQSIYGNLQVIVEDFLNTIGILWCLQPFFDGNTRTILMYSKTFFLMLGYDINIENLKIPIFYNEKEKVNHMEINNVLRLVRKIN